MTDPSDRDDPHRLLVERIQQGIDYELDCERLFLIFRPPLLRFFRRRGYGAEDCEDLTQQTLVRVFKGIGTFHFESRFAHWIFEIATRVWLNEHRRVTTFKRKVVEERLDELSENRTDSGLSGVFNSGSSARDPLAEAVEHQRREALQRALEQFPPQMRRCIQMRLNGLKYREIAALMKISIETVKAHLHQARKRLAETFGPFADRLGAADEVEN